MNSYHRKRIAGLAAAALAFPLCIAAAGPAEEPVKEEPIVFTVYSDYV
ncbi:MAG: hypothetical protein GF346_11650 [Candidatus Eisenbacteria bacterium]|nr:hypothetical protein [Candidatus Latescibacterota bacterium]MBD3303091.1 hypothetical protein [Candidatus Eisenbacteria bacterium]